MGFYHNLFRWTVLQAIRRYLSMMGNRCVFVMGFAIIFLVSLCPVDSRCENMAGGKTIIVGGDRYYPPYEYIDENGDPAGYNVELSHAIADVMGFKIKIQLGPWREMRTGLENGDIDVLQGIVSSAQRSKTFDFTPHHTIVHESLYRRRDRPPVTNLATLAGKAIIVQNSGRMHDFLLETGIDIKLILTDTHADALRLLASGQHDYALVSNLPALYLGKKLQLSNILPAGKPVTGEHYCFGVKKGNTQVLTLFSEGLAILKNTGRHQQIYEKWLGALEVRRIAWRKIIKIGVFVLVPLLLIVICFAIWSYTLKREVANRTEQLYQHQQQLIQADKMASLGILVSGVAHEINNPNSLMLLNIPVLKDAYADASPILEEYYLKHGDFSLGGLDYSRMRTEIPAMLAEMQAGAVRINGIVDDLKDFGRQEDSHFTDDMDFIAVARAAVRLVDNTIKKSTHNFSTQFSDNLPPIRGNSQRIEQVIVNLILNACQALTNPDKSISLMAYRPPNASHVMLEVHDQGVGIDKKHLAHVTDPFFTTKRDTGGTGLGMSVSAAIVREHEGSLTYRSNPCGGTIAILTLPINGKDPKA